jgi:hypothetical protein
VEWLFRRFRIFRDRRANISVRPSRGCCSYCNHYSNTSTIWSCLALGVSSCRAFWDYPMISSLAKAKGVVVQRTWFASASYFQGLARYACRLSSNSKRVLGRETKIGLKTDALRIRGCCSVLLFRRYNEVECSGVLFRQRHSSIYTSLNSLQHRLHFVRPLGAPKKLHSILEPSAGSYMFRAVYPWPSAEDTANNSMTSVAFGRARRVDGEGSSRKKLWKFIVSYKWWSCP